MERRNSRWEQKSDLNASQFSTSEMKGTHDESYTHQRRDYIPNHSDTIRECLSNLSPRGWVGDQSDRLEIASEEGGRDGLGEAEGGEIGSKSGEEDRSCHGYSELREVGKIERQRGDSGETKGRMVDL